MNAARLFRASLYAGGFLGPFGSTEPTAILPEIATGLETEPAGAALLLSAYLFPFAVFMLISGTLGARWGITRTLRLAYLGYTIGSMACGIAPTLLTLLIARAAQGMTNAFITPLLLVLLAEHTPRRRLGHALGTFGALQAAGATGAPLVGGICAELSWRLPFAVIAVIAATLGALTVTDTHPGRPHPVTPWRQLFHINVLRIGAIAMIGWAALGGLSFLMTYRFQDTFGLGSAARGILLTSFGAAGVLTARLIGIAIDSRGVPITVAISAVTGGALIIVAGTTTTLGLAALAWAGAGMASQGIIVGANAAVLAPSTITGAGATSVVQAFRFIGAAAMPRLLTPAYMESPALSFLLPGLTLAIAVPLLVSRRRS